MPYNIEKTGRAILAYADGRLSVSKAAQICDLANMPNSPETLGELNAFLASESGGTMEGQIAAFNALETISSYPAWRDAENWLSNKPTSYQQASLRFSRLNDYWRREFIKLAWLCFSDGQIGPGVWGIIVKLAHQRGKVGSLLTSLFDYETASTMIDASESRARHWGDRNGWRRFSRNIPRIVYRGGSVQLEKLALGISWTDDLEQARWFANKASNTCSKGSVISTIATPCDILACYDDEREVVLRSAQRSFQLVA